MPDETARRHLFVVIDRATRWVFIRLYRDQSEASANDCLRRLVRATAMSIVKILTDNGSQFTDRFTAKDKRPTGQHVFDKTCAEFVIEHRLAPPRHPQTNRMVGRINGRVGEVIQQTRFASAHELGASLTHYVNTYNHPILQRSLNHISPVQALKKSQPDKPLVFVKRPCNRARHATKFVHASL